MAMRSTAGFTAIALLFGTLACAGNTGGGEDETAAAPQDTTETQNPPGYRGMEEDTSQTQTPTDSAGAAVDTFLQQQGTGVPADTQGYGGFEQPDTTAGADQAGQDTTGAGWSDTTSSTGVDTSGMSGMSDTSAMSDTSGMAGTSDTSSMSGMTDSTSLSDTTSQQ